MANDIDARFAIADNDILAALTGIVNAQLADGIADSFGEVHPVSVVIWRQMGATAALPDETVLSVIVHLGGNSIAPFAGSLVYVKLEELSHAATLIFVRAMRLAEDAQAQLDATPVPDEATRTAYRGGSWTPQDGFRRLEPVSPYPAEIRPTPEEGEPDFARAATRMASPHTPGAVRAASRFAGPFPFSGDELARLRAGVSL